ncbi:MAG TPA: ATP-dependent sacrificial sulfur transferase LarE, partial [Planctomycetota bacterium]|nr:ATP-dependent sacrificial sulfur transferase LarE [Planctomycetota bacterium]
SKSELHALIQDWPGAVVAFSGGVDSSVLLTACVEILGSDKVLSVIAVSPSLARAELAEARKIAGSLGVELKELRTGEFSDKRYLANSGDRCFWCKEALFQASQPFAIERGWVLCYGENASDDAEDRAGSRSASSRLVRAPLREVGWTKTRVREFARSRQLSVSEKPAMPCLSSRIPVGIPVTVEALERIERMEIAIKSRGFQIVRARDFGLKRVRIEIGTQEVIKAQELQEELLALAQKEGYKEFELAVYC